MSNRFQYLAQSPGRHIRVKVLSLAALAIGIVIPALASDWKDALKESLEASYPLSKRASFSPDRITQQGVVLVIQKQGIAADPSSDGRHSGAFVLDGQLGEQGRAVVAFFGKKNTRVFTPGEKVDVIGIKVGDDYVMLELMSCDMFDVVKLGSTKRRVTNQV